MKKWTLSLMALLFSVSVFAQGVQVGDKAPDFQLKSTKGDKQSLASYEKSKGLILIFTCNHCPYSVAYEDRIIALHNTFVKQGYPVLAINPNDPAREPEDSYDNMIKRAKDKKFPFSYLFDETQATARAYGATRTPHVFILQRDGKNWTVRYIGAIDDNSEDANAATQRYVEAAVNALLQNQTISTTTTKAIGCTIKWKKS
jgi:peroxiredoxin